MVTADSFLPLSGPLALIRLMCSGERSIALGPSRTRVPGLGSRLVQPQRARSLSIAAPMEGTRVCIRRPPCGWIVLDRSLRWVGTFGRPASSHRPEQHHPTRPNRIWHNLVGRNPCRLPHAGPLAAGNVATDLATFCWKNQSEPRTVATRNSRFHRGFRIFFAVELVEGLVGE